MKLDMPSALAPPAPPPMDPTASDNPYLMPLLAELMQPKEPAGLRGIIQDPNQPAWGRALAGAAQGAINAGQRTGRISMAPPDDRADLRNREMLLDFIIANERNKAGKKTPKPPEANLPEGWWFPPGKNVPEIMPGFTPKKDAPKPPPSRAGGGTGRQSWVDGQWQDDPTFKHAPAPPKTQAQIDDDARAQEHLKLARKANERAEAAAKEKPKPESPVLKAKRKSLADYVAKLKTYDEIMLTGVVDEKTGVDPKVQAKTMIDHTLAMIASLEKQIAALERKPADAEDGEPEEQSMEEYVRQLMEEDDEE